MGFALAYKTVLEVAVWHHFWVDPDGGTFTLPPNPGTPEALDRLFDYDIRRLLDIRLTRSSLEWIRRKGLIFKPTQTHPATSLFGQSAKAVVRYGFDETGNGSAATDRK